VRAAIKESRCRTLELSILHEGRAIIVATLVTDAPEGVAFPEPKVVLSCMPFGDAPTRAQWQRITEAVDHGLREWAERWPKTFWSPP
jgi:hypothetical protein